MNNKVKYISILAAFSLLTGCGAFNSNTQGTEVSSEVKTEANADTTAADETDEKAVS